MKKLIFACSFVFLLPSLLLAVTIYVPDDYTSIQEAVNNSTEGDTIFVSNGTYDEYVAVTVPVVIIGEDWENTIVNCIGSESCVFYLENINDVEIKNMTIMNFDTNHTRNGIWLENASQCNIEMCRFHYHNFGVYLLGSSDNTVQRCFFEENRDAISMNMAFMEPISNTGNEIKFNMFESNSEHAFNFMHVDGGYHQQNLIIGNLVRDNPTGMYMIMSDQNTIHGNHFVNNTDYAIYTTMCMGGGQNNVFYSNNFLFGDTGTNLVQADNNNTWCCQETDRGNFWENYEGTDNDGNGIGDEPHTIPGMTGFTNVDYFPLMERLYARVSGYVYDAEGQSIEGASISVVGTNISVTTEIQGFYLIENLDAGFVNLGCECQEYVGVSAQAVPTILNGESQYNFTLEEDTEVPPEQTSPIVEFHLEQNYPNPFNSSTNIKFELDDKSAVRLEIFDINGRKVKTMINNDLNAGYHKINWNGINDKGQELSSGIYFYRLNAGVSNQSRKMILIK